MQKTNNIRKYILAALLFVCFCVSSAYSQTVPLMDSLTLDTVHTFTNLAEALKNPDKVYKLDLRKKKLKEFPREIFQFKNLQYLDLSKNSIKEIPAEIAELTSLQYFNISKNHLESLPAQIGELTQLYYLNANQNDLISLPPQIGKLSKLKYLDLWSNNIEKFPSEMRYLKSLKVLDLRVILIPDAEQERIQQMLPKTKIYFSPFCKCQQ
jgi:Leucine-rich repeat (LRR) protein